MLIDTHSHVNFNAFKDDSSDVIDRALRENIWVINVGSQLTTSERAVSIATEYKEGVYAIIGLHPIHLHEIEVDEEEVVFKSRKEEFDRTAYQNLAINPKVIAIGETGLDYFRLPANISPNLVKAKQQDIFRQQLVLAIDLAKPVSIHCRGTKATPPDAYQDTLTILKEFPKITGVIHCFSGSEEIAEEFLNLGFYISFTGIVTFLKAEQVQQVVKKIPLERILLETDAPYLAPQAMRGKRNEPAFVKYIAEKIAELKGVSLEEVAEITTKNAKELFKLF